MLVLSVEIFLEKMWGKFRGRGGIGLLQIRQWSRVPLDLTPRFVPPSHQTLGAPLCMCSLSCRILFVILLDVKFITCFNVCWFWFCRSVTYSIGANRAFSISQHSLTIINKFVWHVYHTAPRLEYITAAHFNSRRFLLHV